MGMGMGMGEVRYELTTCEQFLLVSSSFLVMERVH